MNKAQEYLHQPVFITLAEELWRRWYLKGDFGQTLSLRLFAQEQTAPLASLLGYTAATWQKKKSIKIAEVAAALAESNLAWELTDFVTIILQKPLRLKAVEIAQKDQQLLNFQKQVRVISPIFSQLTTLQLSTWQQKLGTDLTPFDQVAKAWQALARQQTFLRLPVFAYEITGNPHTFDPQQVAGQLLLQVLAHQAPTFMAQTEHLEKAEIEASLLAKFYLLKDDIKNYAAIYQLTAFTSSNQENQMWRQACLTQVNWNVPLKEILRMDKIVPFQGNKVFVVENSSVYALITQLLPTTPCVCSSGQFTFAIWQLLRKLVAANVTLYYSGDLDPEGLLMAQKLQNAFGRNVRFLAMKPTNFEKSKTLTSLTAPRLKQLTNLQNPELKALGQRIEEEQAVAYQEGFLSVLLNDIKNEMAKM